MSEDWLKPDDPMPDFVPAQKGDGKKKRFGDVFGASAEAMRATDLTSSEAENQGHAFREIDQAILDDFGGDASAKSSALMALDVPSLKGLSTEDRVKLSVGSAYDISMLERYKVYRDGLPPERRDKIPDPARIEARAREIALHRYTEAEKEVANGKGFSGGAAQFLGGTAGAMTDPVNLGSMFVFKRPITTFKGAVAYGAATSGATEIVLQPVVQQYRQEVGLPAGWDEGLQNVVYATIGGGVFGAGEGGLIKLGQALDARKRRGLAGAIDAELEEIVTRHESGDLDAEGVQEEFAALAEREPAFAAAMEISQRARAAEQAMEENPFGLTPQDLVAHEARIKNAEAELVDTPAPHIGEDLPPVPDVAQEVVPPYLADLGLEVVNLTDLARDPKRFQFKASDADGVTDALQDIDEWVPERAGALLVWEGLDGARYIANGHQRHALGLRLMEGGADPIQSPAFILREADGVTAEQAMVRGALVNIGEGSGTSLDAARILRADPEMITNLPPRSPLVREAQGLTRLSDDAFGLVVNEKVSPRWGALVGKAVEDPDLQGQIALALQAADPRTATEAASIVADLQRAPVVEGTTIDLFGESGFKQALIAERAKVKAAALSQLSRDKRAFATLNRRADRIEAEGNRLDREGNEQVEVDAATLAERLDAQAHVKGDVSDALNKAAQAVADGQSIKQAARGLIDALDGGADGGGAGRGLAAGGGSAPEFAGGRAEGGARGRLGTGLQDLLDADAGAPGTARAIKAHEVAAVASEEFGPDVAALIARAAEAKIKTGKIETAAVRYRGKIWRAASHEDAMAAIEQATGQRPSGFDGGPLGAEAGFVDDYGKFLTREDAALAAMAAGQITDPSIARVMEMRLKRGEAVPLATEHVALANKGGRFTFGGLRAKWPPISDFENAEKALATGQTEQEVWRTFGWRKGVHDGKWRFEIDDSAASFRNIDMGEFKSEGLTNAHGKLGRFLKHKKLFHHYPWLKDVQVEIGIGEYYGISGATGEFQVRAYGDTVDDALSVLLHEIQHVVQHYENFTNGGGLDTIKSQNTEFINALEVELETAGHNRARVIEHEIGRLKLTNSALNEHLDGYMGSGLSVDGYRSIYGEIEARNVQARQHYDAKRRLEEDPETTQDIPSARSIAVGGPVMLDFDLVAYSKLERIVKSVHNEFDQRGAKPEWKETPEQFISGMMARGLDSTVENARRNASSADEGSPLGAARLIDLEIVERFLKEGLSQDDFKPRFSRYGLEDVLRDVDVNHITDEIAFPTILDAAAQDNFMRRVRLKRAGRMRARLKFLEGKSGLLEERTFEDFAKSLHGEIRKLYVGSADGSLIGNVLQDPKAGQYLTEFLEKQRITGGVGRHFAFAYAMKKAGYKNPIWDKMPTSLDHAVLLTKLEDEMASLVHELNDLKLFMDSGSSRFAFGEAPVDVPRSELARMATRFVNDDASVVQAAIREAVLCAGGEPMAGLGQLAAGSALGLGLGLAAGGAVIAYGTPQQRDDRYEAWFTQLHPDEQSYAPLPKSHQRALKKMRRENREALMWRVQLERQTRDMFRSNLDAMPDYQGQLRVNSWAERFTGVSASFLDDMIIQESAGRWDVQAPTSSATGGMQFINSTWRNMLRKHGESYGLKVDVNSQEALDLRTDPRWGTVMGAEYAAENGRWLGRRLDRRITQKDAYLAHFLGRDGALALLRARPTAVAADIMPRAAAANLNVFYQNGDLDKPRTVSGVIQRQTRKFSSEPLFVDERFEERGA